jgi:hypothetical protein
LESWDDLPDEVLGLPFAADILTNRYEMPVAPKEDPVVRERLSSEQFPVRMSRDLAG